MSYNIRRVNSPINEPPVFELWLRSGEATSRLPPVGRWQHPYNDPKPKLAGLYQRIYGGEGWQFTWSWWTGARWMLCMPTLEAAREQTTPSVAENMYWRGLTSDPVPAIIDLYAGEAKAAIDAEEREAERKRNQTEEIEIQRLRIRAIDAERAARRIAAEQLKEKAITAFFH
jgi:hypothetical protein